MTSSSPSKPKRWVRTRQTVRTWTAKKFNEIQRRFFNQNQYGIAVYNGKQYSGYIRDGFIWTQRAGSAGVVEFISIRLSKTTSLEVLLKSIDEQEKALKQLRWEAEKQFVDANLRDYNNLEDDVEALLEELLEEANDEVSSYIR